MMDETHRAILRRIAPPPAGRADAGAADMVLSALRMAAVRAGDEGLGLMMSVAETEVTTPDLPGLEAEMQPETLAVLLSGGEGRTGLAVYSVELAMALLEWRLTGGLADAVPPPRAMTQTDAAILADYSDPLLAALGAKAGADWACGYSQGAVLGDPRHLALRLAPGSYHGFRLSLSLGGPARGGGLFLALPGPQPVCNDGPSPEVVTGGPALRGSVLEAALPLTAVLWRLRLPAAAVRRFAPGQELVLPAAALSRLRLEAAGGTLVAHGRLGQAHGERAVRLDGPGQGPDLRPAAPPALPPQPVPEAEPQTMPDTIE